MARKLLVAAAIFAIGPVTLASQSDPRLAERLDQETLDGVQSIIEIADTAGLPVEPLVDKALEGASKRAPGTAIIMAVERLHADMVNARAVLGEAASESELTSGAHALRAGLDAEAIGALRDVRPDGDLTIPLGVLTDLVAVGVTPELATRAVTETAEDGASDAELLALQRAIVNDIRAGYPPVYAASIRSGIPTAAPPPVVGPPVVAEGVGTNPEP